MSTYEVGKLYEFNWSVVQFQSVELYPDQEDGSDEICRLRVSDLEMFLLLSYGETSETRQRSPWCWFKERSPWCWFKVLYGGETEGWVCLSKTEEQTGLIRRAT